MIIMTGGAGMMGANIIAALNAQSETDILVVDDLTDGRKFANLADLRIADYIDRAALVERVATDADFGPVKAIFHQRACSATTEWDGTYMMANNYEYSKTPLGYAQKHSIPYIYASSATIYGNSETFIEAREYETPLNVYAYSKLLFDDYVWKRLDNLTAPVLDLRYFNVYGPREGHKRSMASVAYHLFNQINADGKARLFGAHGAVAAGMQARDFVHVEDVAAVNLWAAQAGISGVYNCGTGRAEPFLTVAKTMIATLGRGEIDFIDFPEHLVGRYQSFTQADLDRLRAVGCDQCFRPVEEGVAQYARWLSGRASLGLPI